MNKKSKILFFCMIFAVCAAFGQDTVLKASQNKVVQGKSLFVTPPLVQLITIKNATAPSVPPFFLSPNFYASQLGFFCRQEIKFDKLTKIPFRFRLGSVADCNKLEGKLY